MGGFFGVVSTEKCAAELFYGTDYQSHLGTRRGGMATYCEEKGFYRAIHNLENTYFRTRFESELPKFEGKSGIGVISDTDAQPMLFNSHLGRFALVTVAKVNNIDEIADHLLQENMHLSEFSSGKINPTELIGLLIVKGKDFVDGIENVFRTVKGSCSMLLLTENGIIAARDAWGRTPIVVGEKEGAMAATSENTAFPNLGYETSYYVGPGEIVHLTASGMKQLRKPNKRMQICSFLWVYYGFPTSSYEGKNVEDMRYHTGRVMGEEDETEVDSVGGIPDSGIGMAIGYSAGHNTPYQRGISKYTPTWPRSFTPANHEMRSLVAKMKLIANRDILTGKRVLFCDDSIVRGTQLRETVDFLYENGAKEVHIRSACPPIMYGCKYLNFSRATSDMELIARSTIVELEGEEGLKYINEYIDSSSERGKNLRNAICDKLHFTSLEFQSIDGIIKAIGLPADKICTYCWNGEG